MALYRFWFENILRHGLIVFYLNVSYSHKFLINLFLHTVCFTRYCGGQERPTEAEAVAGAEIDAFNDATHPNVLMHLH
ncbi:unnamed protein product [Leptosia nina]|uniref:Uncharacterized protein n=1 Tax=Leptosia nina TaxID=320188 RepID=A0AAV1JYW6_9NEOP